MGGFKMAERLLLGGLLPPFGPVGGHALRYRLLLRGGSDMGLAAPQSDLGAPAQSSRWDLFTALLRFAIPPVY